MGGKGCICSGKVTSLEEHVNDLRKKPKEIKGRRNVEARIVTAVGKQKEEKRG